MTDKPRDTAFEILSKLESGNAGIDETAESVRNYPAMDRRDRAFVMEIVHGVTRWRRALDTILESASSRPLKKMDPQILNLLRMGLYQAIGMSKTPVSAAVNETVNAARIQGHKSAAGFVNAVLRGAMRKIEAAGLEGAPIPEIADSLMSKNMSETEWLSRKYSFPDWIVKRWTHNFGADRAERIMAQCNGKAPAFFRINRLVADESSIADQSEIEAEPVAGADGLYKVTEGALTGDSELFTKGAVQPQDGASYIAAGLLGAGPGETVADACCGKGIKSGLFAQSMENRGVVVSLDSQHGKLASFQTNMRRLNVSVCIPVQADLTQEWPVRGKFDKVFLDAPCSATGLLRRRPEGRWRKTERLVTQMRDLQADLLDRAVTCLADGGALVYAVCSIEPEEGRNQIERILELHPELRRASLEQDQPELADYLDERGDLYIMPGDWDMDGFFAAKLVSQSNIKG